MESTLADAQSVASADANETIALQKNVPISKGKGTQREPRWDLLKDPTEPLAFDIEFQMYKIKAEGKRAKGHILMGEVAFIDIRGITIYDVCVKYSYDPRLYRWVPEGFGLVKEDLWIENGAKRINEVEDNLYRIMFGRVVIGHGMTNDFKALGDNLCAAPRRFVDTQSIYGERGLRTLVNTHLGIDFKWHDPAEDAKVTMLLYLRARPFRGYTDFRGVLPNLLSLIDKLRTPGATQKKILEHHSLFDESDECDTGTSTPAEGTMTDATTVASSVEDISAEWVNEALTITKDASKLGQVELWQDGTQEERLSHVMGIWKPGKIKVTKALHEGENKSADESEMDAWHRVVSKKKLKAQKARDKKLTAAKGSSWGG